MIMEICSSTVVLLLQIGSTTSLVPYGYSFQLAAIGTIERGGEMCVLWARNTRFNFWTSSLDTLDAQMAVAT
jgi:hypothetical protein